MFSALASKGEPAADNQDVALRFGVQAGDLAHLLGLGGGDRERDLSESSLKAAEGD